MGHVAPYLVGYRGCEFLRTEDLPPRIIAGMRSMKFDLVLISAIAALLIPLPTQRSLTNQWNRFSAEALGRVGAAALVVESGERAAMNGSAHFPMQSVYKLPIAMALLHLVDEAKLSLDQSVAIRPDQYVTGGKHSPLRDEFPSGTRKTVRELVRYTIVESDGSASDALLRVVGGPSVVTRYVRSLGITDLVVANSEMEMSQQTQYDDRCTPQAAVKLLVILEKGKTLSKSSRALLLQYMQETETGKMRIRHLLPKGTTVADKTGASGTQNGRTAATNDIGLVTLPDGRHLAIAIFVSDSAASDEAREGVIAKIARAAWDEWVPAR